jgi:hypothetical protein
MRTSIGVLGLVLLVLCFTTAGHAADTDVRMFVTNGGTDTGSKGEAHYYPLGRHTGGSAGWARSGGTVRIPEGVYDARMIFADGEVRKNLWLDNRSFAGSVEKTAEFGAVVAPRR